MRHRYVKKIIFRTTKTSIGQESLEVVLVVYKKYTLLFLHRITIKLYNIKYIFILREAIIL